MPLVSMSESNQQSRGGSAANRAPNTAGNTPDTGALFDFADEKIPLFLLKLWKIMEDPSFGGIICWDDVRYFSVLWFVITVL